MIHSKWDARIDRARALQQTYPFASEGLRFFERIARFQKSVYSDLGSHLGSHQQSPDGKLRNELDLFFLLPRFGPFLSVVAQHAPDELSRSARELHEKSPEHSGAMLSQFWEAGGESLDTLASAETLISWIFLQPYAEYLADRREPFKVDSTPSLCPLCGSGPIVGVLRPLGDGAKKSLICMLCAHEWDFRRVYCPACGEEREPQMAFYSVPEIAHVRVDVCDTCHTYLKCVDLTKTGLAVPIVDELATIPLDLWAREHGYTKLQTNFLGI